MAGYEPYFDPNDPDVVSTLGAGKAAKLAERLRLKQEAAAAPVDPQSLSAFAQPETQTAGVEGAAPFTLREPGALDPKAYLQRNINLARSLRGPGAEMAKSAGAAAGLPLEARDRLQDISGARQGTFERTQAEHAGIAIREEQLLEQKQALWTKKWGEYKAAREKALFPYAMDIETAKKAEAIRSDPNATASERSWAAMTLKKAQEPDLQRIFGDSTAAKVLSLIGIGIGQWGASYLGKPNAALGMLNDAIDRDLRAQNEAANARRAEAAELRGDLGLELEELEMQQLQWKEKKAHMMAAAAMAFDNYAAQSHDVNERLRLETLSASITTERLKLDYEVVKDATGMEMRTNEQLAGAAMHEEDLAAKQLASSSSSEARLAVSERQDLRAAKAALALLKRMRENFGETSALAPVSRLIPGTNERNYDLKRRVTSQMLARGIHGARASDKDVDRIEASLPKSWAANVSGVALLDEWEALINDKITLLETSGGGSRQQATLGEGTEVPEP